MEKETSASRHHELMSDMHGRGHWGTMLIKILVALFIFWAGVQFGELKAMVRSMYHLSAPGYNTPYGMMGDR